MTKRAFLFAGQGAQKLGMAKAVVSWLIPLLKTFDAIDRILGYDLP